MPNLLFACLLTLAYVLSPAVSIADQFKILAWNVESNRPGQAQVSDPGVISEQLSSLLSNPATRAQIVALSEVEPKTVPVYKQAVAEGLDTEVDFVTSASGGYRDTDSLLLVVDAKRFAIEDVYELHRYKGIAANFNVMDEKSPDYGAVRARSPLVARIRDKTSSNSSPFWLIVNHLARGEEDLRIEQAKALKQWAEDHASEPVITAGDFNFDYDFKTQKGNPACDAMMEGGVWQWLKPDPLVDSNWADDRDNPGHDRYPDSILDFVFVANGAKNWRGEADVVVREGDFPDSDKTSDHRPIIATFNPEPTTSAPPRRLAPEHPPRLYELRVIQANPGKLASLHSRLRDHLIPLLEERGVFTQAVFTPAGENSDQRVYLLTAADGLQTIHEGWTGLRVDPKWLKVIAETDADGKLVADEDYERLVTTYWSPAFKPEHAAEPRTFELRTYTCPDPGKHAALLRRFHEHTMKLFEKHGMQNVVYWVPDEEPAAKQKLVYLLGHKSEAAAKESFASFRADPDWLAAKKASEEKAGGSLTNPEKGVVSEFLEATGYSPLR